MATFTMQSIGDEPTLEDVVDAYERFRKDATWIFDRNIDFKNIQVDGIIAKNIKAGSIETEKLAVGAVTAEKITVDELSAISANLGHIIAGLIESIEIYGSYISTARGTFPRIDFSSVGNLLQAFKSLTEYIAISPSATGSPTISFVSPNAEGFISAADLLGNVWFNVTTGNMQLQSQAGNVNVLASGDINLTPLVGQVTVISWSKILNTGSGQTLNTVFNNLQSQINSKPDGSSVNSFFTTSDGKTVYVSDGIITSIV